MGPHRTIVLRVRLELNVVLTLVHWLHCLNQWVDLWKQRLLHETQDAGCVMFNQKSL